MTIRQVEASIGAVAATRAALHRVVKGEVDLVVLHDFLGRDEGRALRDAFDRIASRIPTRHDLVTARTIGAYQFGKSLSAYLASVRGDDALLRAMFDQAQCNPIDRLLTLFTEALDELGITLRPARHDDEPAGRGRAIEWTGGDEVYLLGPHEDCAQLTDPAQLGFEIQQCVEELVLACNIYCTTLDEGGAIVIWDCMTDAEMRARLDIRHSGYPYPRTTMNDYAFIEITPRPGDLMILNGCLVHAVTQGTGGTRLMINLFCGKLPSGTMIYWT